MSSFKGCDNYVLKVCTLVKYIIILKNDFGLWMSNLIGINLHSAHIYVYNEASRFICLTLGAIGYIDQAETKPWFG